MLEGITAGFILSLALFPGAVWLVKVSVAGNARHVFAVAVGFGLSQLFWLYVSIPGLLMMLRHLTFILVVIHFFAMFVLGYMAIKTFRGRRIEKLNDAGDLPSTRILFRNAFNQAFAMPMRLPMAMAVLLATGVYTNNAPTWEVMPDIMLGGLVGVTWWWGQLFILAVLFAKSVPEHVTLKSLNRIRPFCGVLFCLLSIIVLLLAG